MKHKLDQVDPLSSFKFDLWMIKRSTLGCLVLFFLFVLLVLFCRYLGA
jgi:hypothetical protein